jgi:hypothetical protein
MLINKVSMPFYNHRGEKLARIFLSTSTNKRQSARISANAAMKMGEGGASGQKHPLQQKNQPHNAQVHPNQQPHKRQKNRSDSEEGELGEMDGGSDQKPLLREYPPHVAAQIAQAESRRKRMTIDALNIILSDNKSYDSLIVPLETRDQKFVIVNVNGPNNTTISWKFDSLPQTPGGFEVFRRENPNLFAVLDNCKDESIWDGTTVVKTESRDDRRAPSSSPTSAYASSVAHLTRGKDGKIHSLEDAHKTHQVSKYTDPNRPVTGPSVHFYHPSVPNLHLPEAYNNTCEQIQALFHTTTPSRLFEAYKGQY